MNGVALCVKRDPSDWAGPSDLMSNKPIWSAALVLIVMSHLGTWVLASYPAPSVLWNFTTTQPPAFDFAEGVVFATPCNWKTVRGAPCKRQSLVARNCTSGALKWNVSVSLSNDTQHTYQMSTTLSIGTDSVFALVTEQGEWPLPLAPNFTVHAVKKADGSSRWKKRIQYACWGAPFLAAARGIVFTLEILDCSPPASGVLQNVTLLALSEVDGKSLWSKWFLWPMDGPQTMPCKQQNDNWAGGFHVVNDTFYVLNEQGLTAYEGRTGTQQWHRAGDVGPLWCPAVPTASLFTEGHRAVSPWAIPPPPSRTVYTVISERGNTTWPCRSSNCTLRSVRLVGIDHANGKDVFSVRVPDSLVPHGETAEVYVNVNQTYAVADSWEGAPYFVVVYDLPRNLHWSNPADYVPGRLSQILHLNHSGAVKSRFELQNGVIRRVYPWGGWAGTSDVPTVNFEYGVPMGSGTLWDPWTLRWYTGTFLLNRQGDEVVEMHGESCDEMLAGEPLSSSVAGSEPVRIDAITQPLLLVRTSRILSWVAWTGSSGAVLHYDLVLPPHIPDYYWISIPPILGFPLTPEQRMNQVAAVISFEGFCNLCNGYVYTVLGWSGPH